MPTYVYKFVATGETIEVEQAFSDATLTKAKHPRTGRQMAVKKVFQPVGVTFKGTGFFKTDSRGSTASTSSTSGESGGGGSDGAPAPSSSSSDSSTPSATKESGGSKKSESTPKKSASKKSTS